ncbi:MAG: hypothetical protein LBT21_01050 [Oscillospiraceae bacterium]|jgi:hypothetical protein|nr:hypothetical protein [Oscillospiraceae bacterium]
MFRLIKNEIKSTAHSMMGIYLATIIAIGLLVLAQTAKIGWLSAISFLVIILLAFLLVFITIMCIIMNFSRSLYGAEGYLSFALPVKGGTLLGAKTTVSVLWLFVSFFISIGVFFGTMTYVSANMENSEELLLIKDLVATFVSFPNKGVLVVTGLFNALFLFLLMLVLLVDIFFAITLANTRQFQNQNVLWGILFSFIFVIPSLVLGINLTNRAPLSFMLTAKSVGIISEAMTVPKELSAYMPQDNWGFRLGIAGMLFMMAVSAGLLYLTAFLMNRKTNVK